MGDLAANVDMGTPAPMDFEEDDLVKRQPEHLCVSVPAPVVSGTSVDDAEATAVRDPRASSALQPPVSAADHRATQRFLKELASMSAASAAAAKQEGAGGAAGEEEGAAEGAGAGQDVAMTHMPAFEGEGEAESEEKGKGKGKGKGAGGSRAGGFGGAVEQKPSEITDALASFMGLPAGSMVTRNQAVRAVTEYAKKKELQDPKDRRNIICDETLKQLLGVETTSFFGVNRCLTQHFPKAAKRSKAKGKTVAKTESGAVAAGGHGFNAIRQLSDALSAVLKGRRFLNRPQVVKYLWRYIKENNLSDKALIYPDDLLAKVTGPEPLDSAKLNKVITTHMTKPATPPTESDIIEEWEKPEKKTPATTPKGKSKSKKKAAGDTEGEEKTPKRAPAKKKATPKKASAKVKAEGEAGAGGKKRPAASPPDSSGASEPAAKRRKVAQAAAAASAAVAAASVELD